jgi:hypothetical protein
MDSTQDIGLSPTSRDTLNTRKGGYIGKQVVEVNTPHNGRTGANMQSTSSTVNLNM